MRYFLAIALFATGCMELPLGGPRYDSVRERMSEAPTSLFIHDEMSAGSITAQRRGSDGWIAGTTDVTVDHGYVRAALDGNGQLEIDQLEIALAPISLDGVFAKPAELQNVILRLTHSTRADATWTSSDNASATLPMTFDFDWWIAIDGEAPIPLATQQLPSINVGVDLGGNGDVVEASVDISASGVLWNWADLVQITSLDLTLGAKTAD
ncbi:MAG TPA: hypothetical protein VFV99_16765 [Kofleriaceae bacterium]|nr:hypothetical protein [Kofleriaceae bacterium]